ncbi:hypothetical protein JKG47_04280 [Acidithiobacillus sp. MC6.1]|nr:hypothetical protein [Acidithiobacillus sp. MC6.1]
MLEKLNESSALKFFMALILGAALGYFGPDIPGYLFGNAVSLAGGSLAGGSPAGSSLKTAQKAVSMATQGKVWVTQVENQQGPFVLLKLRYPNGTLHDGLAILHHGKIAGFAIGPVYGRKGQNLVSALLKQIPPSMPSAHHPNVVMDKPKAVPATTITPAVPPAEFTHPAPPASKPVKLAPKMVRFYLQHTQGFVWGSHPARGLHPARGSHPARGKNAKTPLYAFVDPNCIFCHKWYESEKAAVNAGKISFHIVTVATLKPSSIHRAIEILEAKNPLQAWLRNENRFHSKTETGGLPVTIHEIPTIQHPLPKQKAIAINTTILYRLDDRHPVTPTFADSYGTIWLGIHHDKEMQDVFSQKKTH